MPLCSRSTRSRKSRPWIAPSPVCRSSRARPAPWTHDYLRNGVTTLFAAFNVLEGTVLGRCMQRHRHQEFLRFLNAIEDAVPAGKVIHVILDNYASHKHPKVLRWLARHPRCVFHFPQPRAPG